MKKSEVRELRGLVNLASGILLDEIAKYGAICDLARVRIYDKKSVGVQGDFRTYGYIAEITLKGLRDRCGTTYNEQEFYDFIAGVSVRIPNQLSKINRVALAL